MYLSSRVLHYSTDNIGFSVVLTTSWPRKWHWMVIQKSQDADIGSKLRDTCDFQRSVLWNHEVEPWRLIKLFLGSLVEILIPIRSSLLLTKSWSRNQGNFPFVLFHKIKELKTLSRQWHVIHKDDFQTSGHGHTRLAKNITWKWHPTWAMWHPKIKKTFWKEDSWLRI